MIFLSLFAQLLVKKSSGNVDRMDKTMKRKSLELRKTFFLKFDKHKYNQTCLIKWKHQKYYRILQLRQIKCKLNQKVRFAKKRWSKRLQKCWRHKDSFPSHTSRFICHSAAPFSRVSVKKASRMALFVTVTSVTAQEHRICRWSCRFSPYRSLRGSYRYGKSPRTPIKKGY